MRIKSFHIDGFGIFHAQGIPELSPGLCVFEGANESGKSTLVEFFRYAFFGPAGRNGKSYPALRGGKPGGRLRLQMSDGTTLLLERGEGGLSVHDAPEVDGGASPAASLDWLEGLDRITFERVFAIGLEDLQGLDVLTEEGLRGRLLAAGSGLGQVDLPEVLARLGREQKQLLLLRGKKPSLNRWLHRERQLDQEIAELQDLPERFHQLERRGRELQGELEQAQKQLRRAETRRQLLQILRQAREPWLRWRKSGEEIDRLAEEIDGDVGDDKFDLDALTQWEHDVAELEQQQRVGHRRVEQLEERQREVVLPQELAGEESAEPDEEPEKPAGDRWVEGGDILHRRREALAQLRGLIQQRELFDIEERRIEDMLEALDQQQSALRRRLSSSLGGLPLWALPLVLFLPLLLAALEPSRGVWLAAAGTILGWLLIVLGFRRRQRQLSEQRRKDLESELGELDQHTLKASQELLDVQSRSSQLPRRIAEEAARAGWKSPADTVEVERLAGEIEEHVAALEARRQIDLRLDEERAEAEALEQRLADSRRTLGDLLAAAGGGDASDYRRRVRARSKLEQLRQSRDSLRLGLEAALGTGEEGQRLESALESSEPIKLQAEQDELERRTAELAEILDKSREELGSLNVERARMSEDERLGALLLERQVALRRIDSDTLSWATKGIARSLLEEARETYETRRQPRVLRRAAEHLAAMTENRYRLLPGGTAGGEAGGVVLEDDRMGRKGEGTWSSGLADLVYLALRLALAEELGRHREPLPLILDDVLVRCDPERRRATARVLTALAGEHQIFFFTCHPDSRRALAAAAQESVNASALYRLRDGVLAAAD